MPTLHKSLFVLLALAASSAGCAEPDVPDGPVRAQVLTYSEIDFNTGVPRYELAERELSTLENFDSLRGSHHRVYRGGELLIREVAGSVVFGRFEGPSSPELRYDLDGDTVVARDYPTLVMLSAFHHFERVLLSLSQVTNLTPEALSENGPLEIFFEPSIVLEGEVDASQTLKFNAFYLSETKQFGLAQRSPIEELPLAASPVVIAHEFGHRVFDRAFFADAVTTCTPDAADPFFPGRLEFEYAISGLNEGYADFLSFAIHGTVNPLGEYSFAQDRNFRDTSFRYASYDDECGGRFYCIGTLFARSLFEAMSEFGLDPAREEDRQSFSKEVYAALDACADNMRAAPELMPAPSSAALGCERSEDGSRAYDGQVVGAFLHGLLQGMPEERRAGLCERFVANFGTEGFPVEARELCP